MKLQEAIALSNNYLLKIGFSNADAKIITEHLIDSELCGKPSHGLIRLPVLKNKVENGVLEINSSLITTVSESSSHVYIDAKRVCGMIVIQNSLNLALKKLEKSAIVCVGLKDIGHVSGRIGYYADFVAQKGHIFLGFNSSPAVIVPHQAKTALWGTNPFTAGIPSNEKPIIADFATSRITWGEVMLAKNKKGKLPTNTVLDEAGLPTIDPQKADGILPIAEHKGSALAYIVEILGGVLTNSRVNGTGLSNWGTFYILINPSCFRSSQEFKKEVTASINQLKENTKDESQPPFFPGEQSAIKKEEQMKLQEIEVPDELLAQLK